MGSRVRLWRWAYRWFRPLQKEEFNVEITPRGELAGFDHDAAGRCRPPSPPPHRRAPWPKTSCARASPATPPRSTSSKSSDVTRAHRVDRTFTWKERDFELHDATYRLEVTILGNEVGGYREYLKVPEQWTRDYQRLRSKNEVAADHRFRRHPVALSSAC